MYLYGQNLENIAIKVNPVDYSFCKSFSELILKYEVQKLVCYVVGSEKRSTYND